MTDETNDAAVETQGDDLAAAAPEGFVPQAEYDALLAENRDVRVELADVRAQLDTARAELEKNEGALTKAKAKIAEMPKSPRARKIGPVEREPFEVLAAAIAGPVTIVFSDGKREITGLPSFAIDDPGAWVARAGGILLRARIDLSGPAVGASPYAIAGVGLLDGEDRQIAWQGFDTVLLVPVGQTVQLRDTILF